MSTTTDGASLATTLDARLHRNAIGPEDSDHERVRRGHNKCLDHRPALIARLADADDLR